MSECFGKSWTVVLFSFVLVCCYMYAVHGAGEICMSQNEMDHRLFVRENFNNISYLKNVCLDLGRFLHGMLALSQATKECIDLASIDTKYQTEGWFIEYNRFDNTPDSDASKKMFKNFNSSPNSRRGEEILDGGRRINIREHVDLALYRLFKTNYYKSVDPLINEIRKLKNTYSAEYANRGLVINDVTQTEPPTTPFVLFQRYPILNASAVAFLSHVDSITVNGQNALYVAPYEMAVTRFEDENVKYIGSDGVEIGIMVIIWHTRTLAVGVAHINQTRRGNIQQAIANLISIVNSESNPNEGRLELTMIGGYFDLEFKAEDVFYGIMVAVHKQNIPVHLHMACVGTPNTINTAYSQRRPRIRGAVLYWSGNINTSVEMNIHPATFNDRGPDYSLRIARIIANNDEILNFYDNRTGHFSIGLFHYDVSNGAEIHLLSNAEFVAMFGHLVIQQALLFLRDHPTSIEAFPNNQPRVYKRSQDGSWIQND